MVRWGILILLFSVFGIRYLWVVNHQIEPQIGDWVRVTGEVWNGKIRVQNQLYSLGELLSEQPNGQRLQILGKVESRLLNKKWTEIGLSEGQITQINPSIFLKFRTHLQQKITNFLPGDLGGLASGILMGGNQLLSGGTQDNFIKTGLSHVVAASGYNVSFVSVWLLTIGTKLFGKRSSIYFAIVGTILYTALAGMTLSVIRAGLMSVLAFTAMTFGRKSDPFWSLLISAVIMLLWDPLWINDIGFQLSLAATAGIVLGTGWGETLMAQLTTLPLILHHFGQLSVVAPLANLLVIWLVPWIMQLTTIGLIFTPVLYLVWPLLAIVLSVIDWLGKLPWASLQIGKLGWGWVLLYYLVLILVINFKTIKLRLMR